METFDYWCSFALLKFSLPTVVFITAEISIALPFASESFQSTSKFIIANWMLLHTALSMQWNFCMEIIVWNHNNFFSWFSCHFPEQYALKWNMNETFSCKFNFKSKFPTIAPNYFVNKPFSHEIQQFDFHWKYEHNFDILGIVQPTSVQLLNLQPKLYFIAKNTWRNAVNVEFHNKNGTFIAFCQTNV